MSNGSFEDHRRAYRASVEQQGVEAAQKQQEHAQRRQLLGEFVTEMETAGIAPTDLIVARSIRVPERERFLRDPIPATIKYEVSRRVPAWLISTRFWPNERGGGNHDFSFATTDRAAIQLGSVPVVATGRS
jgi:hypothetical protein